MLSNIYTTGVQNLVCRRFRHRLLSHRRNDQASLQHPWCILSRSPCARRNVHRSSLASLIQATYAQDWIKAGMSRAAKSAPLYIPPGNTLASTGHASGPLRKTGPQNESLDAFKMTRFQKVGPRTQTYRFGQGAGEQDYGSTAVQQGQGEDIADQNALVALQNWPFLGSR